MEGPLPCNTFYPHSTQGTRTWLLDSLLMSQVMEEKRRGHSIYLWAPRRSRYLFRTRNECHSNEYPQNLLSGDKISQDSSKDPTQLGRDCTPKQTGDRSSDPWTRRDLSHPGDVNLKLANAPTSPCHHHIGAAYDCSMYYQLSNPFCICPGQQATTRSASSTRIYKTTANHGKYHSPLDVHSYKNSQARD